MPTRNITLTEDFDDFVQRQVSSGRYSNASEVVREALPIRQFITEIEGEVRSNARDGG